MLPVQRQRCDWHFSGLFFVSRVKYRWSKPGIPFCTIWMKKTHPASICNVPIIFVLSLHSRFTSGKVEDAVQIIQRFLYHLWCLNHCEDHIVLYWSMTHPVIALDWIWVFVLRELIWKGLVLNGNLSVGSPSLVSLDLIDVLKKSVIVDKSTRKRSFDTFVAIFIFLDTMDHCFVSRQKIFLWFVCVKILQSEL